MTEIKLRDYQREAIDAVFAAWSGGMRRPAIVLPTGAGKTVVFSALVKEFRERHYDTPLQHKGLRVMILAHRDELVDQAIAKLRAVMPGVNVGKVKAESDEITADVMVCSVQTLASMRRLNHLKFYEDQTGEKVGLIITDECHHAAAASYKKIYAAFPNALQLGVTATMARGDGVGLGSVWEDVVYRRSILNLIAKGHLTDVRTVQVDLKALDMASVGVSRGDWAAGDLGRALMESEAETAIARAYEEHAGDRQGLVFTPTVETARAAWRALNASGVESEFLTGETPRGLRQDIYAAYRKGRIQVLVNCMVLTEGFDMPQAEVAVIARPTRNAALYTQMVGRVLRPWPGKTEALVLDLVGASANRLRTLIDLEPGAVKELREGESLAEAVMREAEEGNRTIPAGSVAFELKARDVDSFGASGVAWVRSAGGVMFIACGEHYVFLWPSKADTSTWDVGVVRPGERAQQTPYRSLSIGEAMAWGEAVSEDYAAFSVAKSARWRVGKPSPAQLAFAESLGIAGAADMTRGELSTAIDRVRGGELFDGYLGGKG